MTAHPEHHLHDEPRGDQHYRELEVLEALVGQELRDAQHDGREREREADPAATPAHR
jgi:hypothetical protein